MNTAYALQQYRYWTDPDMRYPTVQEEQAKTMWIKERAHEIYTDDDYILDLFDLCKDHSSQFQYIVTSLRDCHNTEYPAALEVLKDCLKEQATNIAISEASVRFGF